MRKIPRQPAGPPPAPAPAEKPKNLQNISIPDILLPESLAGKQSLLKPHIENSHDIINRPFFLGVRPPVEAAAIYINGVIDIDTFNDSILRPLMVYAEDDGSGDRPGQELAEYLARTLLTVAQFRKIDRLADLVRDIYDGMLMIMLEGSAEVLSIDIHKTLLRAIEEPAAERGLRGSREGFIENLDVNISMVRRRLRDPKLVVRKMVVGQRTRTQVGILYVEDIADPNIVKDIETRINTIQTDGVVASGIIEQFIQDRPWSVFYQYRVTEKPDKAVMQILEGRVLIIVDGTPTTFSAPSLFVEFFQSPGDYYERTPITSFVRILRYLAFILAVSISALYVALINFQPELIPPDLLVPIARFRNQVPFPVAVEVLLLEIMMQLVIEAGFQLPGNVGQTVGVVGGIIMGQAAITARFASPAAVIVVAFSAMCTFVLPSPGMALASRLLRLPMILVSATFGIFGFFLMWLLMLTHLTSLTSIGVPYLSPLAPTRYSDLKDGIIRSFLTAMNKRPVSIPSQDKVRQAN
ncbi:MAG: spore germination protein [Syntrophomonadaceae bacterium]